MSPKRERRPVISWDAARSCFRLRVSQVRKVLKQPRLSRDSHLFDRRRRDRHKRHAQRTPRKNPSGAEVLFETNSPDGTVIGSDFAMSPDYHASAKWRIREFPPGPPTGIEVGTVRMRDRSPPAEPCNHGEIRIESRIPIRRTEGFTERASEITREVMAKVAVGLNCLDGKRFPEWVDRIHAA